MQIDYIKLYEKHYNSAGYILLTDEQIQEELQEIIRVRSLLSESKSKSKRESHKLQKELSRITKLLNDDLDTKNNLLKLECKSSH